MGNSIPPDNNEPETPPCGEVSGLLRAWSDGDRNALDKLTPIVYDELHRLARSYMKRERTGHSLQTSALVNEAYMRLVDYKNMQWQNRSHFFAVSAQLMRRILVDHARRHNLKRGRGVQLVSLDETAEVGGERAADLVALDSAMDALERIDRRKDCQSLAVPGTGGRDGRWTLSDGSKSIACCKRCWSVPKASAKSSCDRLVHMMKSWSAKFVR